MAQFILLLATVSAVITGKVFEARTGKPLAGVNLYLEGEKIGTSSDLDGNYTILNVPTGTHELVVSMLGYKNQRVAIKVRTHNDVIQRDFYLEEKVIPLGKEVLVKAKRPELRPEVSGSIRTAGKEELSGVGTEDISKVLSQKAGITSFGDTDIHIRGGRSNEILMYLDGVPIRDPLSGSAFGIYVPAVAVKQAEVLIGGYNAEYGQAMSGVINVELSEGTKKFYGTLELQKDNLPSLKFQNTDRMNLMISGPLVYGANYWLSMTGRLTDTYLPSVDRLYSSLLKMEFPRGSNSGAFLMKVSKQWSTTKAAVTLGKSIEVNQGYFYSSNVYPFAHGFPYRYMYHLDGYPTFTRIGEQAVLNLSKIVGTRGILALKLWRFFTGLRVNVDDKHWTEYDEILDLLPEPSDTHPFPGDGFFDYGDAPYWHDHYAETYGMRADFTFKRSSVQEWKTGIETDYITAQWLDIQYPWYNQESGLGLNYDLYKIFTTQGAYYLQSQFYFSGMVANLGMRFDYWIPGKRAEEGVRRALKDPLIHPFVEKQYQKFSTKGRRIPWWNLLVKYHFSPRVGVSYPVTERDKFYFNYGHFSQIPDFKYIYSKLGRRATATYELVGNPNLDPTVTVSYELGVEHLFNPYLRATVTAYYKDIFNYPTAIRVPGIPPNPDFWMYINSDYARSFGVEFTTKWNPPGPLYTRLEFSLSQAKGRASTSEDVYWSGQQSTLREWYLRWDQPYKVYIFVSYRTYEKETRLGPLKIPPWFDFSITSSYSAGRRYTPVDSLGIYGDPNSRLGPSWKGTNLRISKGFSVSNARIWLQLWVDNLFNNRNVYYVNPMTGRVYEPGDPLPPGKRPIDYLNPARYRAPRTVYFGIKAEW